MMSMIVATSLIGCKSSDGNIGKKTETAATVAVIADKVDKDDEKLEGKWAGKYTLDETQKIFKEKSSKIENITKELGIKYTKDEKIKKENNESFNDKSIYFDNENP